MSDPESEAVDSRAPWTVARVLAWATQDFRERGMDSPRLDAELLLGRVLQANRVKLLVDASRPLIDVELSAYRQLIQRRRKGEPVAYLLGEREFYGLPFKVDGRVLIPRPDSEALVEVGLERTQGKSEFGTALDLCTGSGCILLAFASRRPHWRLWGRDLEAGAVELARENALRLGRVWNVAFEQADLFAGLAPSARFDLITANAPYVSHPELGELDAGILDFEPRVALDGGPDGLAVVRRIVEESPRWLAADGVLALEIGYDQAEGVTELLRARGYRAIERRRDYGGHERVVSARAP